MDAETVDWTNVAEDVAQWVRDTQPREKWARWVRIVLKRSAEHWRKIIAASTNQPPVIEAIPMVEAVPIVPIVAPVPIPVVPRPLPRREPASAIRKRQTERISTSLCADSSNDSAVAARARASAAARSAIHGASRALEAGALAAAQATAALRLEQQGVCSVRSNHNFKPREPTRLGFNTSIMELDRIVRERERDAAIAAATAAAGLAAAAAAADAAADPAAPR